MSWGCLVEVLAPSLHSLEGLGLGRNHNRGGTHPGQVPRAQFWGRAGLGVGVRGRRGGGWCTGCTWFKGLGGTLGVARWWLREGGCLAIFLKGCHSRNTGSLAPGCHVVHHGLSGGGAWARAAGARWGKGVGLHQFGFGSFCILPEISTKKYGEYV